MTTRLVVVAAGRDTAPLALAMLEDVVDLVAQMREVQAALAAPPDAPPEVLAVTWPRMPVLAIDAADGVVAVIEAAAMTAGADEVAVVCADAPDLPALLLGKLHSALSAAQVAVCPADDGRLVAVAARLPMPDWLRATPVRLDDDGALLRLRAAAPSRTLVVGPGWHRVRDAADAARLDPGLEGWEATRAVLGG